MSGAQKTGPTPPKPGAPKTHGDSSMEALRSRLHDAGLRVTPARVAVLRLLTEADAPLSHGEACDRIASTGVDRATVYRNLVDFTEAGIARRTDLGDQRWRFELAEHRGHAHDDAMHPHFVCTECGAVECLPDGTVRLENYRGAPKSLRTRHVEIQVRGACNDCSTT